MIRFMGKLRGITDKEHVKLIYNSLILPHLDYADVVWDWGGGGRHADMIQNLQNRAGRVILKVDPYSHTSNHTVHQILKWDTLDSR